MKDTSLQFQREAISTGSVATDSNSGIQTITRPRINTIRKRSTIKIVLIADDDNATADISDVYPIWGAGSTDRATFPAGVTWGAGSDYATAALMNDYLQKVGVDIASVKMQSEVVANYGLELGIGMQTPNNRNIQEETINLTDYRENVGNGFSDVIMIKDRPFTSDGALFTHFQIVKNSTLTIYLDVVGVGTTNIANIQ